MTDNTLKNTQTARHNLIAAHKEKLETLRVDFTKECSEITAQAKQKITAVPESDQATRRKILADQEADLNKVLSKLSAKISQLNHELLTKLEQIETAAETAELDNLTNQIQKL